ncbi:uncharacterized protein MYCFIDRAFT_210275 [Pseudocercospora fijiensis CIRAD86]|uniref:GDP/GTP exchange factor Sec2 N-terminal domain-containing protein n=1 Tax=Pseudocercospora fijiensis (strain CIRAD86) TaxID=383855 RepID=M3B8F5_PSEFD|nr:uncharacterized protein MYCFIDRAFT_210275 [Pseudocercospora fijiensis CIRAD86]EME85598.1 hypothetical protein MYCFIDRAFT_210275 [Pseudocercospora fijiensis CIRAD86]
MASGGLPNGVPVVHRHGAHDSALDVEPNGITGMQLRELEEENTLLVQKATAAAQRFADYENEIRVLKEQLRQQHNRQGSGTSNHSDEHKPAHPPERPPGLSRLGSFMRKASLAPTDGAVSAREHDLEATLVKEQTARIAAENKVKAVNAEVEELSASLFQQANDMVAQERRENAALRDKIKELETAGGDVAQVIRKENERLKQKLEAMEQRDAERKRRLEKLEAAQKRIDRVRTMLTPR